MKLDSKDGKATYIIETWTLASSFPWRSRSNQARSTGTPIEISTPANILWGGGLDDGIIKLKIRHVTSLGIRLWRNG